MSALRMKKAAAGAIAATLLLTGTPAIAQEGSSDSQTSSTESSVNDGRSESSAEASDRFDNLSTEVGSTDLQNTYNENRDILRPILLVLAGLQIAALALGPIRTLIYNIAGV